MTYKEKAKELVEKFKQLAIRQGVKEENLDKDDLIQCALITVDEILDNMRIVREENNYQFWQQVKTEIEKL